MRLFMENNNKNEINCVVVNKESADIENGEIKKFYNTESSQKLRVIIPSGIVGIGIYAFNAPNIVSIHIGRDVEVIHCCAFARCKNFVELTVDPDNPILHSASNCVINTAHKRLVIGCRTSIIPDDGSMTSIWSAFYECIGLTSIKIPEGVTLGKMIEA